MAGSQNLTGGLSERLRSLPSVRELAAAVAQDGAPGDGAAAGAAPAAWAVPAAREVIERRRVELMNGEIGPVDLVARARELAARMSQPAPRPVINATGVVVHTNLGRAPLTREAGEAAARVARGYSDLELDLDTGRRGSRQGHTERLLCELTGAEAALVVNNCAGAVLLAAAALGGPGRSLIVSRGQLVEIGGSFRIPDVVAMSGARLVEVGTTNRTRLADYQGALESPEHRPVGAVLRVHQSNFRTLGFAEEVSIEDLCRLGVPVIDDVGSGALADELAVLADEPLVRRSVAAGAALVCFSGDKLLGGPQAGVMVGARPAVGRARGHPLARALRIDKLCLAALQATLQLYRDPARAAREIPVLAMLGAEPHELRARAQRLADRVRAGGGRAEVVEASARVGGGALPLLELPGWVVALAPGPAGIRVDELAGRLRRGSPPVIGRISQDRMLLDPRTMTEAEAEAAAEVVVAALGA